MASTGSRALLIIAWLIAISLVVLISFDYGSAATRLYGIADDQEQTIRFAKPVNILSFGSVSGSEVAAGDLIVQVAQPELDAQIQGLTEKLEALRSGNSESRATMRAQIIELGANRDAELSSLDSDLRELKARINASRSFLGSSSKASTMLSQEVQSLRQRRRSLTRAANARINDIEQRLAAAHRPVDAQLQELEQQRQDIERQQAELTVHAKLNGRMGSVMFKPGDRVPPYAPIATVHGSHPSFIKGFIHESVFNDVRVGQQVWVQASEGNNDATWHPAAVESLGSRIVEFPLRLKVNSMAQAWGREVMIRMQGQHGLLLGERVEIQLQEPETWTKQLLSWQTEVSP